MNNPFTNSFNAAKFNTVSKTKGTGGQDPRPPGFDLDPEGADSTGPTFGEERRSAAMRMRQAMQQRNGGGYSRSNNNNGSGGGGSGGGGSGGGSGGGGGGGGSDPYAGMPDWIRDYYGGGSSYAGNQPGSDGYFTSGGTLQDILYGEANQMQGAANRHFGRVLDRENQYLNFLDGIQGRYEDSRIDTSTRPEDYASVRRAEQEYAAFEDRTAQDISSTVSGFQAQFRNQIDSVNNGMRADGSMMSAQEQADSRFSLNQQMGTARQQAVTGIMSNYNQQKSALGMQVAGMTGQAEQLRQQAQIVNMANQMKALELENSGRNALAQLTLNNPETVVSVLGGLMALNEQGAAMNQLFGSQSNNAMGGMYMYQSYLNDQNQDWNNYGSGPGTSTRWYNDQSFEQWLEENGGGYG